MKLPLNESPLQRIRRIWHEDHAGYAVETRQDVEPIVVLNKEDFKDSDGRYRDDLTLVARIPISIYMDLQRKGIADDDKAFKRWLNDPDQRVFKAHPGRL